MKNVYLSVGLYIFQIVALHAQIWVVDPLEAIYPDENNIASFSKEWSADFIPATEIAAHVLVKVPKNTAFSLSAQIEGKQILGAFSELIDVPVEQNTGIDSRTEKYKGVKNPDVIREAPFRIFEVIKPIETSLYVGNGNYQAFRFSLPEGWKLRDEVTVNFKLTFNDATYSGLFNAKIYPIEIPSASESNFFYTNWFSLSKMEYHHGLERWSSDWFKMLDKYAALMAHGRQNAILIPNELLYIENGILKLEEDKLWQFLKIFRKHGFQFFEAPHLMNRGANDDWGDPELKVALTGKRYYTEGGIKDIEHIMILFRDFAEKYNLVDNWLQHISDEPTAVNAECYRDVSKQVKSIFPQVRIMEATNDRDNLKGAIDIWCPIINDFQDNEAFFRSREEQGEQILVYTCLIPGGKWLNRTLDMEKLRQVYFGWGAAHYNTDGYLHWGLNQYQADPYQISTVKHPSPAAGPNNYLPAGDTHIIYPGDNRPLSSLRFEAHRIGIEDYELLEQIKGKNLVAYKNLMQKIFRSYTDYNVNIMVYREVKKELLQLLMY
ncbi:DUF4091 domain-containing protein [Arenibacter certesii]|uniref:Glycoside hydrolase 123 catalytic domain-containing protein n=1 Tax=Arenibacter certesii TaxID=228955 RepID=A0A918J3C8_9FLAO|nr:DUF4091 domain-containing protein [Arenibacter certesii]GGW45912.1 hypothetical protein GCM10007383_32760 [Arenibacter certesii]